MTSFRSVQNHQLVFSNLSHNSPRPRPKKSSRSSKSFYCFDRLCQKSSSLEIRFEDYSEVALQIIDNSQMSDKSAHCRKVGKTLECEGKTGAVQSHSQTSGLSKRSFFDRVYNTSKTEAPKQKIQFLGVKPNMIFPKVPMPPDDFDILPETFEAKQDTTQSSGRKKVTTSLKEYLSLARAQQNGSLRIPIRGGPSKKESSKLVESPVKPVKGQVSSEKHLQSSNSLEKENQILHSLPIVPQIDELSFETYSLGVSAGSSSRTLKSILKNSRNSKTSGSSENSRSPSPGISPESQNGKKSKKVSFKDTKQVFVIGKMDKTKRARLSTLLKYRKGLQDKMKMVESGITKEFVGDGMQEELDMHALGLDLVFRPPSNNSISRG